MSHRQWIVTLSGIGKITAWVLLSYTIKTSPPFLLMSLYPFSSQRCYPYTHQVPTAFTLVHVWVLLQKQVSIKSILIILWWPSRAYWPGKFHIYCCTTGLSSGSHSSSIYKAWLQIAKYSSIAKSSVMEQGACYLLALREKSLLKCSQAGCNWPCGSICLQWLQKTHFPELEASQVRMAETWTVPLRVGSNLDPLHTVLFQL